MSSSNGSNNIVTIDDLHAAARAAGDADNAEECGIANGAIQEFLIDSFDVWADKSLPLCILWGIAVGVLAEQHRIHRTAHHTGDSEP